MTYDPLEALKKLSPNVTKKMEENSNDAFAEGDIPVKYKYLIAMALDAADGADDGVAVLGGEAIKHGATKDEIAEVLEILHYINGGGRFYICPLNTRKYTK
jgi:alkylhydroperoxidase/carboxymuconolactone decarboxylase family protein YurZ